MVEKHFGPVWFIPGENRGKYPYCHSVYVEGAGVLIDPASDRDRLIQLKENPGVKEIWLSHWHEDHMMHLDLFEDLPLVVPQIEAPPLSDMEIFMDWYGLDNPAYRAQWRPLLINQFHYRPRTPSRVFEGNEIFTSRISYRGSHSYPRPHARAQGLFLSGAESAFPGRL